MNMKEINLGEMFYQHKNKVVNTAILILAMLLAHNIYQHQLRVGASLRQRIDTEEKKNVILNNIQLLEKKIKDYKNFFNRKDISVAMNIISEITQNFAINVVSIKPLTPKEKPLYIKHFFYVKLEASNYHEIGKFIGKLESRSELYCVEDLRISQLHSYGQERRALGVELTISTILLKD